MYVWFLELVGAPQHKFFENGFLVGRVALEELFQLIEEVEVDMLNGLQL